MRKLDNELKNKVIDYEKLIEYGFFKDKQNYIFKAKICDDKFEMIVNIADREKTSKVIDLENDEEYILVDIQDSIGTFVGKVRQEYEEILKDIIESCTSKEIFNSNQALSCCIT